MDAYVQFSIQKDGDGFMLLTEAGRCDEKERQPGLLMLLPDAETLKQRLMMLWMEAASVAMENKELDSLRTNLCMRTDEEDTEVIDLCRELASMMVATKTGEVVNDAIKLQ